MELGLGPLEFGLANVISPHKQKSETYAQNYSAAANNTPQPQLRVESLSGVLECRVWAIQMHRLKQLMVMDEFKYSFIIV